MKSIYFKNIIFLLDLNLKGFVIYKDRNASVISANSIVLSLYLCKAVFRKLMIRQIPED